MAAADTAAAPRAAAPVVPVAVAIAAAVRVVRRRRSSPPVAVQPAVRSLDEPLPDVLRLNVAPLLLAGRVWGRLFPALLLLQGARAQGGSGGAGGRGSSVNEYGRWGPLCSQRNVLASADGRHLSDRTEYLYMHVQQVCRRNAYLRVDGTYKITKRMNRSRSTMGQLTRAAVKHPKRFLLYQR